MNQEEQLGRETIWSGWLIKSPPRKKFEKIWKCRWRRRWFVLRQGELPGQFCLEYYTDQTCSKLKGQIDLDQCEEVDAGLRLVEKYQNIFVVTIPQRVYYLAADTEEDMRVWVKCICQVCGLQDITPVGNGSVVGSVAGTAAGQDVQYFNIGKNAVNEAPLNTSTETNLTLLNATNNNNNHSHSSSTLRDRANNYQNFSTLERRDYTNRETILCEASLTNNNELTTTNEYTNWGTIERTQSLRGKNGLAQISHNRTQSLEQAPFRRPDNLKLPGSSGPYIPISECYSDLPFHHQYSPKHINNNSDTESVFTDDEWRHPVLPHLLHARTQLQSETALNSEQLQWNDIKRFSKVQGGGAVAACPPRPPKRADAADLSPRFIGPREKQATVEESYDIPRSHQIGTHSRQGSLFDEHSNISPLDMKNIIASSTPNLLQADATGMGAGCRTLPRQNWYTNAAPTKIEGTIFRYDFAEGEPPAVNRKLKPKAVSESSTMAVASTSQTSMYKPPSVDRKLKPAAPAKSSGTRKLNTKPSMNITLPDEHMLASFHDDASLMTLPKTPKSSDDRLQYLDLDHSHVPPPLAAKTTPTKHANVANGSAGNLVARSMATLNAAGASAESGPGATATQNGDCPSVAYTTVDFVKTDAFNRIRADSARRVQPK